MRQTELIDKFIEGTKIKGSAGSCHFERDDFYSYAHKICRRIADNTYILRRDGYSQTTKQHVSKLQQALPGRRVIIDDEWTGDNVCPDTLRNKLCERYEHWEQQLKEANKAAQYREAQHELDIVSNNLKVLATYYGEILAHETF